MNRRHWLGGFAVAAAALGLVGSLQLRETGRVQLTESPPPQLEVGETARMEFSARDAADITVHSTNDTVASIEIQSADDGQILCRITAHAPGSASLSCEADGRLSPAFAVSVVEPAVPDEPILTSGPYVSSQYSDKYHLSTCVSAQKIQPENRIYYASAADAAAQGLTPCKKCHPE
ncbi:MAG: Ada metal-binding domain-containing protein [Butyricicoccus sp.]